MADNKNKQLAKPLLSRWVVIGGVSATVMAVGATAMCCPDTIQGVVGDVGSNMVVRGVGAVATVAGATGLTLVTNRRALHNFSLTFTLFNYKMKGFTHWNEVDKGLVLGALPLDYQQAELVKKVGITGVLSLVEDFELDKGMFYRPIQASEWKQSGVEVFHVKTEDYEPVSPERLAEAADWIHQHLSKGDDKKIYIHCKAGRGRSSAALCVYLWKYRDTALPGVSTMEGVIEFVKSKRPQLNLNRRQRAAVFLAVGQQPKK